jgi:aspartyl-tRNA(Asn)/glutamyl-tRNA(Gln) amidotransferase subunit B
VRAGDTKPLGYLVGQVMKATGGRADPRMVSELLGERI